MAEQKPQQIAGYDPESTDLSTRACLHLATVLGDYADDIVIVGGLVPYLLVDQSKADQDQRHCGSKDVDVVFSIAIIDEERYEAIANRLRTAGFKPDTNENGNLTFQRWRHGVYVKAVVDFLIETEGKPRSLVHLTNDLAAIITPGASLAFKDAHKKTLQGTTFDGAFVTRDVAICGPGAFIILKSMALQIRSEPKDAYDIYYLLRNYDGTLEEIAERIRNLLGQVTAKTGLEYLEANFSTLDNNGPILLAKFLAEEGNDDLRADCSGLVMELVRLCKQGS